MKKTFLLLLVGFYLLALPACGNEGSEKKVTVSATVNENIYSRIENDNIFVETNIQRPIVVMFSNGNESIIYSKKEQKFALPLEEGYSITIFEAF